MKKILTYILVISLLKYCACVSASIGLFEANGGASNVHPSGFIVCHHFGCHNKTMVQLSQEEWQTIRAIFEPNPLNGEEERQRIAKAIGQIERYVGPKTGTSNDGPQGPIFGKKGELDCLDESVNTTTYLTLLEREGLLKYNSVGLPQVRGYIFNGWFHNTATVLDKQKDIQYAVDSWFHQNGIEPEIITLELWRTGWRPEPREVSPF